MAVVQNMNQLAQTPLKGDLAAIVNPTTLSVQVDPSSVATLVPGDAVVLTNSTGRTILVDKAEATEKPFGFVLFSVKKDLFTANDAMEIALSESVIFAEAGETIARGAALEFNPTGSVMIESNGINPISAYALDNASSGDVFRMLVQTAITNVGSFTYIQQTVQTLNGAAGTIAFSGADGGVSKITPSANATINAASVINGQPLSFVVTTSGNTAFIVTFGTNFKSTGTLNTGVTTAKVFTVNFIGDGTNYNETSRTTAM